MYPISNLIASDFKYSKCNLTINIDKNRKLKNNDIKYQKINMVFIYELILFNKVKKNILSDFFFLFKKLI